MATHAHSTPAPGFQRGLLRPFAGRLAAPKSGDTPVPALNSETSPAPGVVSAHDTRLAAVEAEFHELIAEPWPDLGARLGSEPSERPLPALADPESTARQSCSRKGLRSKKALASIAPQALLPPPAPLPSLTSAFAARRAIFGANHG